MISSNSRNRPGQAPLQIGALVIDPPVALAPMAGYTDRAFRSLCLRHHAGVVYTEVANAEALLRQSRQTFHLLETAPGEHPIAAHIYGSNPEVMARAAVIIESLGRFDFIDVNAGCPVRKIVYKGAGAALMKDPDKIRDIIAAIRSAVSMPVTLKTRIGFSEDKINILEILKAAEEGGAAALALHARHAGQKHTGQASWELLASVKAAARIPVIGNGGITSPELALEMFRQTGVDGIMIAKAAVGNPWIFEQVRECLRGNGNASVRPSPQERRAVILEHLDALTALTEQKYCHRRSSARYSMEEASVLHFRGHLARYFTGCHGICKVRNRFHTLRSREDVIGVIEEALMSETKAMEDDSR